MKLTFRVKKALLTTSDIEKKIDDEGRLYYEINNVVGLELK